MEQDQINIKKVAKRIAEETGCKGLDKWIEKHYKKYNQTMPVSQPMKAICAILRGFEDVQESYSLSYLASLCSMTEGRLDEIVKDLEDQGYVYTGTDGDLRVSVFWDLETAASTEHETKEEAMAEPSKPDMKQSFIDQLKVALLNEHNVAETDKLVCLYPTERFSVGWQELTKGLTRQEKSRFNQAVSEFLIMRESSNQLEYTSIFNQDEKSLFKKGLLQYTAEGSVLTLSVSACRRLFHGYAGITPTSSLARYAELIDGGELAKQQLYFNSDITENVKIIQDICDPHKFPDIIKRLKARGYPAGVCILIYGPPGSGKTELAHQIARESGRMLINVDSAKINRCFVGDSEKAVRNLFLCYRYACAIAEPEPILLLNEADGILAHARSIRAGVRHVPTMLFRLSSSMSLSGSKGYYSPPPTYPGDSTAHSSGGSSIK